MFGWRRKVETPPPYQIELDVSDPAALELEWSYTDRAERLYQTGHRLLSRGYFAEAAELFERATQYDRTHYDAYVALSEALVLLGNAPRAAEMLDDALNRYGRNALLGAARGHVYLHLEDYHAAFQCVDTARDLDPAHAYVWIISGEAVLTAFEGITHAVNRFESARVCRVPWPHADLRMALALLEWGQAAHARYLLEAETLKRPEVPLAWILLGDACTALGKPRSARRAYRSAARLVPELESLRRTLSFRNRLAERWRRLHSGTRRLSRRAAHYVKSKFVSRSDLPMPPR